MICCYPILGLVIGLTAWDYNPAYMPVSLFILPAWYHAKNRFIAFFTVFIYFAAASRGLVVGTMTYLQTNIFDASLTWLTGVLVVSFPFFLLFFNNKKTRLTGLYFAIAVITVPPFGLTSWTHPLASTGIWWPGGGWLALAVTLLSLPFYCRWPALLAIPILFGLTLPHNSIAAPSSWQALNTNFAGIAGQSNCFAAPTAKDFKDDFIKQIKTIDKINSAFNAKKNNVILLPEGSGGTWLTANPRLWRSRLTYSGTVLVGATLPVGNYKDSVILAVSCTGGRTIYRQRMTVPLSMWWPGRKHSYRAHWFNNPVVALHGHRIAFFVCYEQFLTWPILQSIWHKPDLLCATSSVWWATGTNIPAIQHNIMFAWSQLFSLPLLAAINR